MLTLGKIFNEIQADYITSLSELKAVKRSVSRVVDDLNSKMDGVDVFDKGLEMIIAPTTESVAFNVAGQKATLTTAPTGALPGDVCVIYGSDYNNRAFNVTRVDSAILYFPPNQPVFTETASCTYAIYRPWRKTLVKNVVMTDLTYDNTAHTITSAGGELDFLELGVKALDFVAINGATQAGNNAVFQVASVTATVITVTALGKSGWLEAATANDPAEMTIYTPTDDAYSYDLENHRFSLPKSAKKLNQIYDGNITDRLDPKSTQHVVDNDDLDIYSEISRNVYSLAEDLFTGADDILTFKVRRDLVAPQSAYRDAEIDIPQAFEHALKKGVLADLLSLPKYSNPELLKDQRSLYQGAIAELFGSEEDRNRTTFYEKDYSW